MSVEYAIIVRAKTRLESLIERFNTKAQAKFYIEQQSLLRSSFKTASKISVRENESAFADYQKEHDSFYRALESLQSKLSSVIKYKIIDRSFVPSFMFSGNQMIIVIGQDGLVANVAKYAGGSLILAINPDPDRYDGVLLPFSVQNCMTAVEAALNDKSKVRKAFFAEARLDDGQRLLAFNDLFIGAASHVSARYRLSWQGAEEEHSSSGIIVSTHAGSTGWLSSIFNMAYGLVNAFGQTLPAPDPRLAENELVFAVREPFKSARTQCGLTAGVIDDRSLLRIESLMPTKGVIFSDGIENDFLAFNSGAAASIGISKEVANLVVKD